MIILKRGKGASIYLLQITVYFTMFTINTTPPSSTDARVHFYPVLTRTAMLTWITSTGIRN